jgi:hypothetical protein
MISEAEKAQELEALFRRCAADHHQAFLAENGADPEWPDWYAAYLQSPVSALLGRTVTQSALVRWLVAVEEKRRQTGSNLDWPAFYAADLIVSRDFLEAQAGGW